MEMTNEQWEKVHEQTGTDILSIVMDVLHGRLNANDCMEKISEHCLACYEQGVTRDSQTCKTCKHWVVGPTIGWPNLDKDMPHCHKLYCHVSVDKPTHTTSTFGCIYHEAVEAKR